MTETQCKKMFCQIELQQRYAYTGFCAGHYKQQLITSKTPKIYLDEEKYPNINPADLNSETEEALAKYINIVEDNGTQKAVAEHKELWNIKYELMDTYESFNTELSVLVRSGEEESPEEAAGLSEIVFKQFHKFTVALQRILQTELTLDLP